MATGETTTFTSRSYGEVSSGGGEREWEYEKILRKIKEAGGLSEESFRPYLEVARAGMLKPSAGGPGLA